jgi:phosphoribosylformylglycinamidine cyclo-ligase
LVRKIIDRAGAKASDDFHGQSMSDVVMAPTRIYVKSMLALMNKITVKGMAHITGGGLVENVPRVLPENTQAVLHRDAWQLPQLFQWLQAKGGVEDAEMHRVFNCGIGMVVILNATDATAAKAQLESTGEKVYQLGEVVARPAGAHQTIVI